MIFFSDFGFSGTYKCGCHAEFESVDAVSGVCKAPGTWNIVYSNNGNVISLNTTVRQEREVIVGDVKVIKKKKKFYYSNLIH